jgi:hypothetical protein
MMKKLCFILGILIYNLGYTQEKLDSVIQKLKNDSLSLEQFQFLGFCKCSDYLYDVNPDFQLPRTIYFEQSFIQLYDFNTPLARLINKSKMESLIVDFVNVRKINVIEHLKTRDENIPLSPMVICNRIFRYDEALKVAYINMIMNSANFNMFPDYFEQYLKNKGINNIGW